MEVSAPKKRGDGDRQINVAADLTARLKGGQGKKPCFAGGAEALFVINGAEFGGTYWNHASRSPKGVPVRVVHDLHMLTAMFRTIIRQLPESVPMLPLVGGVAWVYS